MGDGERIRPGYYCDHANECPTGPCSCPTHCPCRRGQCAPPDVTSSAWSRPDVNLQHGRVAPIDNTNTAIAQRRAHAASEERDHHISQAAHHLIVSLSDGQALAQQNMYGDILRILITHVGERGESEGAVECLRRIIRERDQHLESLEQQARME